MAQLILKIDTEGKITELIPEGDVKLSFDDVIAFCMSFMESACNGYMEKHPGKGEELYDTMDYLFYRFMELVFPDIQPREFELSDAGLLYAQDQIIKRAEKKGITYEEALKQYEDKAKEYVKKNARLMS